MLDHLTNNKEKTIHRLPKQEATTNYPVCVKLVMWNILAKAGKKGIGVFAKRGSGSEEVCSADVEANPFFISVASTTHDMT